MSKVQPRSRAAPQEQEPLIEDSDQQPDPEVPEPEDFDNLDLFDYLQDRAKEQKLDIYTLVSFMQNEEFELLGGKLYLAWTYARVFICLFMQLVVVPLVAVNALDTSAKGICEAQNTTWTNFTNTTYASAKESMHRGINVANMEKRGTARVVAISMCVYLFFYFIKNYHATLDSNPKSKSCNTVWRLLTHNNLKANYTNHFVFIGIVVNTVTLFLSMGTALVVIYNSPDAKDVVLNSLAIFFVLEVDDFIVTNNDCQRVTEYLDDVLQAGDDQRMKEAWKLYLTYKIFDDADDETKQPLNDNDNIGLEHVNDCILYAYYLLIYPLSVVTALGLLASPAFMFRCY